MGLGAGIGATSRGADSESHKAPTCHHGAEVTHSASHEIQAWCWVLSHTSQSEYATKIHMRFHSYFSYGLTPVCPYWKDLLHGTLIRCHVCRYLYK